MTRHVWILDGQIYIQCNNLDEQYRESTAYLDHKYWDQPTRLKDIPPGLEQDYNYLAPQQSQQNSTPLGKRVI